MIFRIDEVTDEDTFKDVAGFLRQNLYLYGAEKLISYLENNNSHLKCFTARMREDLAGFIVWKPAKRSAQLSLRRLVVDNEYRGAGVKYHLIMESIKEVRKMFKDKEITITFVISSVDKEKRKFYNKIFRLSKHRELENGKKIRFYATM